MCATLCQVEFAGSFLINKCTSLTQTLRMQLSLGKCVLCICLVVARNTCFLSKLLFCFFQGDTILVGGERVASTPQGSVHVCKSERTCVSMYVLYERKRERERESGMFVSVHAFVCACMCVLWSIGRWQ